MPNLTRTTIHDLPDAILTTILTIITDTRTRNSTSLVNHKWSNIERHTRTHLTLRGNIRYLLYNLPKCFTNVTHLDLSVLSPWGVSLDTAASSSLEAAVFLSHRLQSAFPNVVDLTVYSRLPSSILFISQAFPGLRRIKLVRWHQRPQSIVVGSDFMGLLRDCEGLDSIDLSCFYCWTEDVPPALEAYPRAGFRLVKLNLLNFALMEGFKADQILTITRICPNLRDFRVGCMFDSRYLGFLGDDALVGIPGNCKHLRVLHLVDISLAEREFDDQGYCREDAGFSIQGLVGFFSGLGEIEELVLDVGKNVRGSWVALEVLGSRCPNLRVLELGCFHEICKAIESHLDGIALCHRLESLSIKNSADMIDSQLIEIGRGCSMLRKFEVSDCRNITMRGLRTFVCLLRKTLVEVMVSRCRQLDASASVQAVDPISSRIRRLGIDCVWGDEEAETRRELGLFGNGFDLDDSEIEENRVTKRSRLSSVGESSYANGSSNNGFTVRSWDRLEFLSLWIGVGQLLAPLENAGLADCPNLREIHIKVEGDCRERPKPSQTSFGIDTLIRYPKLSKMKLDCGETIGYALTAPSGLMDLSLWERWFLNGIRNLTLNELDYWPPQDREVNQRSLSLPAAGLISQCYSLRKLFIHGTTHEHFMMFFIGIPNLRDVQLRGDYYPAPENDMSTEMRVDSCCRFEDKLNSCHIRQIPD
ncbi:F-box protein MAX2 homolog B [Silene latifolia]|uniref:F-box protein MAX2 homolog B n=1 Tax=Silene latifolia TaxID=37657 RepID=UPI003D78AC3F